MSLKVSRILHAGYVLECAKTQIIFDPVFENPFSKNCYAFPTVQFDYEKIKSLSFDAIFISHYHDDHFSLKSLNLLRRETPIYFYCVHDEPLALLRELGFKNVISVKLNKTISVGAFSVTARAALDPDVDSLFEISAQGLNILNVVDSWIDPKAMPELANKAPWDMVLWPFQTLREIEILSPTRVKCPSEWPMEFNEQLKLLRPKYIVPSSCQFIHESWSWYNNALFPISYKRFENEIKSCLPQTAVVRLDPSSSVVLERDRLQNSTVAQSSSPLSWVQRIDDQVVDYNFTNPIPPATSEISKNFEALTIEQTQQVINFCRNVLAQQFAMLEPTDDHYFESERRWQLRLYDHLGQSIIFNYFVHGQRLETLEGHVEEPIAWQTEVPISRLYGALEMGESLTSMYVRINDMNFVPEIEMQIESADVLQDPLIRVLFSKSVVSYQAAQLKDLR